MRTLNKLLPNSLKGGLIALSLAVLAAPMQSYATGLVNLTTVEGGMHRISHQQLLLEGVDLSNVRHRKLRLFSGGEEVAIGTKGQDKTNGPTSRFGPGGYIEFYADAPDSLYSDKRALTLEYVSAGQRKQITKAPRVNFQASQASSQQYTQTKAIEDNASYDYLSPSKTDPWHYGQVFARAVAEEGEVVDTAGTVVNFELDGLVGATADIEVEVYGIVDINSAGNDHHVVAKINDTEVGDQQFDGNVMSRLQLNDVAVTAGSNKFQMFLRSIESTPFDLVALNKIKLRYTRETTADENGYLEGGFDTEQAIVEGVVGKARVYRKAEDGTITLLRGTKKVTETSVGFNTASTAADYIVVAENGGFKTPKVLAIADEQDISSGDAEYLIITHASFMGAELDRLVQMRTQEYSVKVVDVAQVFAQFGDHLPSADAVQAYINHAAANMQTRFVLLVGSDTYDYKNFGGSGSISFIPTRYATTPGGLLTIQQTPSDASYGDTNGDGVPNIPVGRLSVRTNAELSSVVEKIADYQLRDGYAGRILMAGDKEDLGNGVSFADDVEDMINVMPPEWKGSVRAGYKALPDVDGDQAARDKVATAINAGVSVAAYIGHSSQQQWSRATPPLFKAADIANLNNIDKPTLITQWGCWNTYFVDPGGNSMADQFLVGGLNGAVTVLGASTLTTAEGERSLGIELNKRMYLEGMTIGEAVVQAKQALAVTDPGATDILLGWQIIGDPALKINP